MRPDRTNRMTGLTGLVTVFLLCAGISTASAQQPEDTASGGATTTAAAQASSSKPSFEIYGFAMLDIGHDFKAINPNWFDTMRVTRLPSFEKEWQLPQTGRFSSTIGGCCRESIEPNRQRIRDGSWTAERNGSGTSR